VEAQIAVAKLRKYATPESGDTLEMIERPGGGLSVVMADGQRSGKSAKAISNVVCRKALSLLAEGVRDGAAARAASDYLYTYRGGKVLATLNILSIDMASQTMVITRNNPAPVVLVENGSPILLDEPANPVGPRRGIRPSIREVPLSIGLAIVMFTDGLTIAGDRRGKRMDVLASVDQLLSQGDPQPRLWADSLLDQAVALDEGRPADDISVLVSAILPRQDDAVRRMSVSMPF
jgi:serine phosphatase RsbU (regulator of sigma subunit)